MKNRKIDWSDPACFWFALSLREGIPPRLLKNALVAAGKYTKQDQIPPPEILEESHHGKELINRMFRKRRIQTTSLENTLSVSEKKTTQEWIQQFQTQDIRVLPLGSPEYPVSLAKSPYAPALLYRQGHIQNFMRGKPLAVVGTRSPTAYGKECTDGIIADLYKTTAIVVSGMAMGIDRGAHRAALENGLQTWAVWGQGLLAPQSKDMQSWKHRILENGYIFSPFPPGMTASPYSFLARNKIISGLSLGTVVIESRLKGGAMDTARHCLKEHKKLWCLPGSVYSKCSAGPNALIRSGDAILLQSGEELADFYGITAIQKDRDKESITDLFSVENPTLATAKPESEHDEYTRKIMDALQGGPMSREQLLLLDTEGVSKAMVTLTRLELAGFIRSFPGGKIALCSSRKTVRNT